MRLPRVSGFQGLQCVFEAGQEFVGDRLQHDEALGRAAGLTCIDRPAPDGPGHGAVQVGVFEHDEGIAATEFHRRLLQVLPRPGSNGAAGRDAAGQRHTFDARVVDDAVGLLVRDQQVGVGAHRRVRVEQIGRASCRERV